MHDNFQFGMTLLAILAGILFARRDAAETRGEIKSEAQRLDSKIDKVENKIDRLEAKVERLADRLDGELKALRKDYTEFYAEQRRHEEAIETLKKK